MSSAIVKINELRGQITFSCGNGAINVQISRKRTLKILLRRPYRKIYDFLTHLSFSPLFSRKSAVINDVTFRISSSVQPISSVPFPRSSSRRRQQRNWRRRGFLRLRRGLLRLRLRRRREIIRGAKFRHTILYVAKYLMSSCNARCDIAKGNSLSIAFEL